MTRVLVVDDNEQNLYLLRTLLSGHGYAVDEGRNGAEALASARTNPPDLVISDLLMPVMDGYTLLRLWKADDRLKQIPFIVYTATYTEPRDERLALALGADAFLIKPAEPDVFLLRMREVLGAGVPAAKPGTQRPLEEIILLNEYNDVLVAKLEKKAHQLEERNRELQAEMAERRRVEDQLRQSQKLDAVGRLAGGVAHDFNNMLTIILGHTEQLLAMREVGGTVRESITAIDMAGQRAAALTRQLLGFSRQSVLQPRILDLNQVVADTGKMLRRLLGADIQFSTVLQPGLDRVSADPGQLDQVLVNLAVNARDAMPHGGRLTIETANVLLEDDSTATHLDCRPGPHVMLALSDTGTGIPPEAMAHIFEPFFTTKAVGQGTGLGLPMVMGIVRQSGGCIHVYSEPGHGTTFKIYLPATAQEQPVRPVEPPPPAAGGRETILLVEDDADVRELATISLEMQGYRVLAAHDGQDALAVLEGLQGPLHLVLSDVVMPNLGGPELVRRVRDRFPAVKVMFMSGYTDDAVVRHGLLEATVAFLQKPYTPKVLAAKVREVLDAPAPEPVPSPA